MLYGWGECKEIIMFNKKEINYKKIVESLAVISDRFNDFELQFISTCYEMDKFTKKRLIQIVENKNLLKRRTEKIPVGHFSEEHLAEQERQKAFKLKKIKEMQKKDDKQTKNK